MTAIRARLLGAALLLAAALPACARQERSAPPPVTSSTAATATSSSTSPEPGIVTFEVYGVPGATATIDWGVGNTASHGTQTLPWRQTEVAPLIPFAANLQAATDAPYTGLVSCRITVEGREVASNAEPRAVLCTAMNLTRATLLTTR